MKQGKRQGWKGKKVSGGKAKSPDTRIKPMRPRQVWEPVGMGVDELIDTLRQYIPHKEQW